MFGERLNVKCWGDGSKVQIVHEDRERPLHLRVPQHHHAALGCQLGVGTPGRRGRLRRWRGNPGRGRKTASGPPTRQLPGRPPLIGLRGPAVALGSASRTFTGSTCIIPSITVFPGRAGSGCAHRDQLAFPWSITWARRTDDPRTSTSERLGGRSILRRRRSSSCMTAPVCRWLTERFGCLWASIR